MKRDDFGFFNNLLAEMRQHEDRFFNYTRMKFFQFDYLSNLVKPILTKFSNRPSLHSDLRLFVTLRFLATGDSYKSLSYDFRIGVSTIHNIIPECLDAIYKVLQPNYLKFPSKEEFVNISEQFIDRWNFPNCLGALDGKHVRIRAPKHSGSAYWNYKKFHSIVLFAAVDAQANFIYVDVGAYGSSSDGGILWNSTFGKSLNEGTLDIPPPLELPGSDVPFPYFFVGDQAFPLKPYLMRPYAGTNESEPARTNFNARLSQVRATVEKSFGILAARFRILFREINADEGLVDKIINTTVVLHNFIRKTGTCRIVPMAMDNTAFAPLVGERLGSRNSSVYANFLRDLYKDFLFDQN